MIGITIDKKKKMSIGEVKTFLNPKNVYFPYTKEDKILVKENVKIKEGDPLIETSKGIIKAASISGIVHLDTCNTIEGNSDCIRIENNFKEVKNDIVIPFDYSYTKTEVISLLKECGIVGLGGAGFPTYLKYDTKVHPKTIIINAVECEPYITADYTLTLEHAKELVKTLHILMKAFNIKEGFIAIKTHQPLLKEKLLTTSDKYKKIKIVEVPNLYPMGWEKTLVRYIKHVDYKTIPLEKGIIVNNISTLFAVYEALHFHKPLTERIVTFTGENINNPCNVKVKIGTPITDILEVLGGVKENSSYIIGGPMMGVNVAVDTMPIMDTTNCVLVLSDTKEIEQTCMRCGKCTDNCPVKISPALIMQNRKNKEVLAKLKPEKCIACGICSYICPAKINLRKYVLKAKKEVGGKA